MRVGVNYPWFDYVWTSPTRARRETPRAQSTTATPKSKQEKGERRNLVFSFLFSPVISSDMIAA